MAGVPINFAVPGEGAVLTYNFDDLINGQGIVYYYAKTPSAGGAGSVDYLDTSAGLQGGNYTFGQTSSTNFEVVATKTFELPAFTKPQVIGGLAKINIPMITNRTATGSSPGEGYLDIEFYKDNTLITTFTSSSATSFGTGATYYIVGNKEIPKTNFPIGSKLKIKVNAYLKEVGASSGDPVFGFCWNSLNTNISITDMGYYDFTATADATTGAFTYAKFGIPFKIEI